MVGNREQPSRLVGETLDQRVNLNMTKGAKNCQLKKVRENVAWTTK